MPVLYVDGIAYAGDATNIETIQAANIQQIILLNLNSFFLCLFIKQFLHFYLLFRQKVPFSYTYKRKKRQNVTAAEKNDKKMIKMIKRVLNIFGSQSDGFLL